MEFLNILYGRGVKLKFTLGHNETAKLRRRPDSIFIEKQMQLICNTEPFQMETNFNFA